MKTEIINLWETILFILTTASTLLLGHNLWLVPKDEGEMIKIGAVTSDYFPESDSAVNPERIADFRAFTEDNSFEITDYQAEENLLATRISKKLKPQLAAFELHPHPIVLSAEKFAGYIAHEAAEEFVKPNFVANETNKDQRESYAKFAKVLLNKSSDKKIGHKFEIILQNNPAELKPDERLIVKVLFEEKPIENLRVLIGAENFNEGKYSSHSKTDRNGEAVLEIPSKGLCYVRTHFIRPHSADENFEWESFWASTTFEI